MTKQYFLTRLEGIEKQIKDENDGKGQYINVYINPCENGFVARIEGKKIRAKDEKSMKRKLTEYEVENYAENTTFLHFIDKGLDNWTD